MSNKISREDKDTLYRLRPNDEDLIRNLHVLYDGIRVEPMPEYLQELLDQLPK
ncbi:hypothetical protein [Emcibacter sp. SYSU 3D8]|uniref:hypothetical protein n=1 Tax=Emcibacter sp. SYSU 3D8 TaxID=3133969 RepID=UPI0031FF1A9A